MSKEKSIRESLVEAMNTQTEEGDEPTTQVETVEEPETQAEKPEGVEKPADGAEPAVVEKPVVTEPVIDDPAPVALSGAIKAKWKDLPEDVRAEWKKREDDIHRMMTSHDGDLRMGRTVKEIAAPYEAIIRSEGGTVEGAFKDLLNTSYILRTGTPQQKAQAVQQAIQQFGVDMRYAQQGNQRVDPNLAYLQQEIQTLRKQADPQVIKTQLQQEMERDRVSGEITAFAANPANVHFQTVRPAMKAILEGGQAKDLQDAYDQACWANPSIRASLLKAQQSDEAEKRKAEMVKKQKAAASVQGSPDGTSPEKSQSKAKSIRESLVEAMEAQKDSRI
jgi:hypothetical protein